MSELEILLHPVGVLFGVEDHNTFWVSLNFDAETIQIYYRMGVVDDAVVNVLAVAVGERALAERPFKQVVEEFDGSFG